MSGSRCIWIINGVSIMLSFGVLTGHLMENVAQGRTAVQSSQDGAGAAGRAVDGSRDPSFEAGSCTLTGVESDPWWRVELPRVHRVKAVTITNADLSENGLDGGEIWIGISPEIHHSLRCAIISHVPRGQTLYFPCGAAEGRYVTVRLPGRDKVLSLCEVEVYPEETRAYSFLNLALQGAAAQSSTLSLAAASRAVDGKRNSFYAGGSCSHTAGGGETDPWWRVDLGRSRAVGAVRITNRGDCCAERLDGAEIHVGDSPEGDGNGRCATISHIRAGQAYIYHCEGGGMAGRFVSVRIPGEKKTLTLCEVEVYTFWAAEPLHNVALHKTTVESSTYAGASHLPVSGCAGVVFDDGCCSHTAPSSDPWWRVDLAAVHRVAAVSLTNRGDCCSERILGAEVWIGSSRQFKNFSCGSVTWQWLYTHVYTLQCEGGEGRYVSVAILGEDKTVSLCGVEVYATRADAPSPPPVDELLPGTPPPTPLTLLPPPPTPPPPTPPPPPTASALLGGRRVALVARRLCWSDALLYCRRHHWDLLSLRSREEQRAAEELLRRGPLRLTGAVWLGLRRYMRSGAWFWMSGAPMTFAGWPRGPPPGVASSPCGGLATGGRHPWEDRPCQEPLHFICQSRPEDGGEGRVYFYSSRGG